MPNPISSQLHVDTLNTEVAIGIRNSEFIGWKVFQEVESSKRSNLIPVQDQSHWFRNTATLRARGTPAAVVGYGVGTDSFSCRRVSQAVEVPWEDRDNQDDVWDVDRNAVELAANKIELWKEIEVVNKTFTTGKWATDRVGGTDFVQFADYGGSKPEVIIDQYRLLVGGKIAKKPNVFTVGEETWFALKWHPNLVGAIENIQLGMITTDVFKKLFDFEDVYVGTALYTTDKLGTAEASVTYTRLWGKHILMTYRPPSGSRFVPAAGYIFWWNRKSEQGQAAPGKRVYIRRWDEQRSEITVFEANSNLHVKITLSRAGLFMSGASS